MTRTNTPTPDATEARVHSDPLTPTDRRPGGLAIQVDRIRRRKWLVAAIVAIAGLGGIAAAAASTTQYTGQAVLSAASVNRAPLEDAALSQGYVMFFNEGDYASGLADRAKVTGDVGGFSARTAGLGPVFFVTATSGSAETAQSAATAMARTFAAEINASMVSQRDDNVAAMLERLRAEYGDRTDPEAVDAQNSLQTQINELNADTSNQVTLLEPEGGVTEIGAGRVTTIAMSLAAGLVLGCAAALFAANAARRIDTDYDLVDKLGIEPLDVLPAPGDAAHAGTRAVRVQHLLNLLVRDADGRPVTVSVAPAGTGRAAHDLADDIARQRAAQGERTVLVQADLRDGGDKRPGLAELLASGAPSEVDFMVENTADDLDVVRPGTTNGDPYELFDRAAVQAVLTSLRERARLIVVSTPSMSRAGEAQVLGDLSDSVVLVVEVGTSLIDVQESIRTVAQVDGRLVGVVLVERTARGRS
ncbi:hypothetical protein MARA_47890 [Mycolicibacterium arabiense]|uniref:Chain-length determining protein n=1 Tax=Mycolicibacterium arabiense TaxID=1286181 RepID=A0A7I7S4L9_9MYCO|nr:hypothetical protein MARA_47890 [Mycolicibacterium arabiense]